MKSVRSRRGDYSLCKSYFAIPDVLHVADKHNTTVSLSNPSKQRSTPVTPRAYSNVASCAASVRLNVTLGDTDDLEYLDETVEKRLLNETSSVWSSFITPSRRTRSRRSLFRNLSLLKKRKPKDYGSSSVDFFNRHSDPFQCGCRKCKDAVFDYTKSLVVLDRLSSPWAAAWPPSKRFLKANDSPPQQQSPLRRSRSGRYKRRSAIFGPKPKRDDAFVNSQEWTMSRSVYELKLGVVGSLHSGKTSLVHRYLTGAYTNEESPEGGRFKKEVVLDGQSYLLLIRDEGSGIPEYQFAQWVDAVIFVFSVESQESFETVFHYYNQMSKFRSLNEVPVILVGTQDAVGESSPRVIEEHDGRQMAHNLLRSAYYETCSTYGLNVERVFKDACQKILQQRLRILSGVRTPTPTTSSHQTNGSVDHRFKTYQDVPSHLTVAYNKAYHHQRSVSALPLQDQQQNLTRRAAVSQFHPGVPPNKNPQPRESTNLASTGRGSDRSLSAFVIPPAPSSNSAKMQQRTSHYEYNPISPAHSANSVVSSCNGAVQTSSVAAQLSANIHPSQLDQACYLHDELFENQIPTQAPLQATTSTSHLPTPSSTPTTQRRNRRISNLFRPKDSHLTHDDKAHRVMDLNMGMGRVIPVKQGHLYKKSSKSLNKEWKKKYVCLHSDGRLSYHQTLKDYMEKDANGKEVFLGLATVRIAGRQRPRTIQRPQTQPVVSSSIRETGDLKENMIGRESLDPSSARLTVVGASGLELPVSSTAKDTPAGQSTPGEGTSGGSDDQQLVSGQQLATSTSSSVTASGTPGLGITSSVKKKKGHRRYGSGMKNHDDDDDCEFEVVTCDQKRWEFSATSVEERDEWVKAIEELIEKSLQSQRSQKQTLRSRTHGDSTDVRALRLLPGNDKCADCSTPRPDWASLNLCTVICIECSGIHRNLGSHISKVRSLDLDDWPINCLAVMELIGNAKANAIWESNASENDKPQPDSPRERKEAWIKQKYESKRFMPCLPQERPLGEQLLDAVVISDLSAVLSILPRCSDSDLRTTVDTDDHRNALHIACSNASAACTQLLVWYNIDIEALDSMGRSALWHAHTAGAHDCVSILINAGLDPSYGMSPPSGGISSNNMITGSLSSREFLTPNDVIATEAKLRRQSDVVMRKAIANQVTPSSVVSSAMKGMHQRTSDAFERLPASVI